MQKDFRNTVLAGDCREVMKLLPENSVTTCITDPPYNYEFIGHKWDDGEINRRIERVASKESKTLVKNIPYGSGLAGGVRNASWYKKNRKNIIDYEEWCFEWGQQLFRICKPGATVAVFNSTRTVAHVQVALERAGFYSRDIVVYRRSSGIPKGVNISNQLQKNGFEGAGDWQGWHSCLRNEWEAICVLQKPLKDNYLKTFIEYGTGLFYTSRSDGGFQSNILENVERGQAEEFNVHCTVKPLPLMDKLVKMFVPKQDGALLLDPFAGSGTTLVAAKNNGIDYVGIEIEEKYVEIISDRVKRVSAQQDARSAQQDVLSAQQETLMLDF